MNLFGYGVISQKCPSFSFEQHKQKNHDEPLGMTVHMENTNMLQFARENKGMLKLRNK